MDWIPRELNRAADRLARWGGEMKEERWWVHGRVKIYAERDLVALSDAGISETGSWGAGWLVADRATAQLVAAGSHGGGGRAGADINAREALALRRAMEVVLAIREGRGHLLARDVVAAESGGGGGRQLTARQRQQVSTLLRETLASV